MPSLDGVLCQVPEIALWGRDTLAHQSREGQPPFTRVNWVQPPSPADLLVKALPLLLCARAYKEKCATWSCWLEKGKFSPP